MKLPVPSIIHETYVGQLDADLLGGTRGWLAYPTLPKGVSKRVVERGLTRVIPCGGFEEAELTIIKYWERIILLCSSVALGDFTSVRSMNVPFSQYSFQAFSDASTTFV